MKKLINSAIFLPGLLFILSLPLIVPFFHQGYFPSHDGEWAVVRLSDMYREVKDGQIPPRFSGNLNFGYGYPLFQYAYPLPYYFGLPLFLLHFGLVNSIKLLFALSVPLCGIGMYFLGKSLWNNKWSGLISGILYMYLPYRMVDLYVRGSLGESIASVFFPIIVLVMYKLSQQRSILFTGVLSLLIASLILTHNIMAVLFGIICASYFVFLLVTKKRANVMQIVAGAVGGLLISAFFWLPALAEKNLILLSRTPIADRDLYYVTIPQLLYSSWGYGTPTESNPFTYQIGFSQLLAGLTALSLGVFSFVRKAKIRFEFILFTVLALFFVLMMFPLSKAFWKLPLLNEINYPWTALFPLGFLLALVGGFLWNKNNLSKGILLGIVIIGSLFIIPTAHPSMYVNRGDGFYFTNDATTTSSHELMPLTVQIIPDTRPGQKIEVSNGQGSAELLLNKSQEQIFSVHLSTPALVRLNTIYFPGWHWYNSGHEIPFSFSNPGGVMEARLPAGEYTITALFKNTLLRTIANSISLISFVFVCLIICSLSIKKYSHTKLRIKNHK